MIGDRLSRLPTRLQVEGGRALFSFLRRLHTAAAPAVESAPAPAPRRLSDRGDDDWYAWGSW